MSIRKKPTEKIEKLINELTELTINSDVNVDELYKRFKKELTPELIFSPDDPVFKAFLGFSEVSEKLDPQNRFDYFNLVAEILWLHEDHEKASIYLESSFAVESGSILSLLNEGLYHIIKLNTSKAEAILKKIPEDKVEFYILSVLLVNNPTEFNAFLENLPLDKTEILTDLRCNWNICKTAGKLGMEKIFRDYIYRILQSTNKSTSITYKIAGMLYQFVQDNDKFDPNFISNNEKKDLHQAAELFEAFINDESIEEDGSAEIYPLLTQIKYYLGEFARALHYFDLSEAEEPDLEKQLFRINILLEMDKIQEATIEVDKLLKSDPKNSDLIALKGDIYLRTGKYENALGICGTGLKLSSTGIYRALITGKAKALLHLTSSKESEQFLLKTYEETQDIHYIFSLLFINRSYISLRKVAKYFMSYISKELKTLERSQINSLAMFMYDFEFYELTIKLLGPAYYPQINSELAEVLIISLFKTDKKQNALKYVQEIRITGKNEDLIPLETFLLEDTDHVDYALKLANNHFQNKGSQQAAINYSKFLLKNNNQETALKILDSVSDHRELSDAMLDQYLYCLIISGQSLKALEIINQYCDTKQNYFISRYFIISRIPEVKEFLQKFSDQVKENTGIILCSEHNDNIYAFIDKQINFTIYNGQSISLASEELLEKKKNDTLILRNGTSEKQFRIVEIMHSSTLKWKLFTMTNEDIERPEFVPARKEEITTQEIEELFGKGAQLLCDNSAEQRIFTEMYSLRQVNFGIISTLKNVNLVNTIFQSMFNPEIYFNASSENSSLFTQSRQQLEDTDLIMIDITGCIMLTHLDLWRETVRCFKRIYVAKSTIQLLEKSIRGKAKILGDNFGAIGLAGKKINYTATSKITEDNWQRNIYTIITFIEKTCIVIEESNKFQLQPYKEKLTGLNSRMKNSKMNSFTDSMAIAHLYETTFYSDDTVMRKVAGDSGLNTVSTQPLLAYLFKKKIVSLDKYYLLTTELLNINYGFVHITIPIMLKALKNASFKLDKTVLYYLDCFFRSKQNYISNLGSWFLYYAIKSFPLFMESNDLIIAFYSRYYNKTRDLDKLKEFINLIYKRTGNVEISNLLLKTFIEFKKYY